MYRSTCSSPPHWLEVSGQLHAPAALPPGKGSRYPFYRRFGGTQNRCGRYGEVKIFYPTGTRTPAPPGRAARSQSLYRLSYPGSLCYLCGSAKLPLLPHLLGYCSVSEESSGRKMDRIFWKQNLTSVLPKLLTSLSTKQDLTRLSIPTQLSNKIYHK
jgi:hypothetical protein